MGAQFKGEKKATCATYNDKTLKPSIKKKKFLLIQIPALN